MTNMEKTELEELFGIEIDDSVYKKSEQSQAVQDVFGINLEQQMLDKFLQQAIKNSITETTPNAAINKVFTKAKKLTTQKKKKKLTSSQLYFAMKAKWKKR